MLATTTCVWPAQAGPTTATFPTWSWCRPHPLALQELALKVKKKLGLSTEDANQPAGAKRQRSPDLSWGEGGTLVPPAFLIGHGGGIEAQACPAFLIGAWSEGGNWNSDWMRKKGRSYVRCSFSDWSLGRVGCPSGAPLIALWSG